MPRASEDPEERHADGGHGGARAGGCRWKAEDRVGHDVMETAYVRDPGSEAKWGAVPGPREAGLITLCCLPTPSSACGEMVNTARQAVDKNHSRTM